MHPLSERPNHDNQREGGIPNTILSDHASVAIPAEVDWSPMTQTLHTCHIMHMRGMKEFLGRICSRTLVTLSDDSLWIPPEQKMKSTPTRKKNEKSALKSMGWDREYKVDQILCRVGKDADV